MVLKETQITESDHPAEKSTVVEGRHASVSSFRRNKPFMVMTFVAIILFIALAITAVAALRHERNNGRNVVGGNGMRSDAMMPRKHRGMQSKSGMTDGNHVSGVVISVNGDQFIVAGNGRQTTVKKTDSTTFNTTGKSVAVNDNVTVHGTVTDNVLNATQIMIRNQPAS